MRKILLVLALLGLCGPLWAQKLESCHCYCGKDIRPPCGDDECKRVCHWNGDGIQKDFPIESMPPTLPFEVQRLRAGQDAFARGDYNLALTEYNAAAKANECYAPTYLARGDLYIRVNNIWGCTWQNEPTACADVAAYEYRWALNGCEGRMQGLDQAQRDALRQRTDAMYATAMEHRYRSDAKKFLTRADSRLAAGDNNGAESDYRYVAGLYGNETTHTTKEDSGYAAAYVGLAASLEAQARFSEAVDALEKWYATPYARAYGCCGSMLDLIQRDKINKLKRKQGLCEIVMQNYTPFTLDLYVDNDTTPVCRALAWGGELAPYNPGCFCPTHVREGVHVLAVKKPGADDFYKVSGGIWCPAGAVKEWRVN